MPVPETAGIRVVVVTHCSATTIIECLARLLASPRSLWLLDEPMAPLDAGHREGFGALMAEHLAGGGMVLAAVHDPLPVPCQVVEVGG